MKCRGCSIVSQNYISLANYSVCLFELLTTTVTPFVTCLNLYFEKLKGNALFDKNIEA